MRFFRKLAKRFHYLVKKIKMTKTTKRREGEIISGFKSRFSQSALGVFTYVFAKQGATEEGDELEDTEDEAILGRCGAFFLRLEKEKQR